MISLSNAFKKKYVISDSESYLQLTIMPTEKCNFRCVYCYEDFLIGKMSEDTINGISNLIEHSLPKLKLLTISWFGGEPTLNLKGIRRISQNIMALQKQFDFEQSAGMTTNAYLLDLRLLEEFIDYGIRDYQITLDGEEDSHNTTRVLANGGPTFDRIWNNLLSYRQSEKDFTISLRLHITQDNAESQLGLVKRINKHFGHDNRFSMLIKNIANLGANVGGNNVLDFVPKKEKYLATYEQIKNFASKNNDIKEISATGDTPYICYAAKPRHLTIRADGRLAKCTVMFNDERNDVGRINADGSLDIDGEKFALWTDSFDNLDLSRISCPASSLKKSKYQSNQIEESVVNVA
jgi:uncharacterized protein